MKAIFSLLALTTLALGACALPSQSEEASDSPTAEDELKSSTAHATGYFQIRQDARRCVSPMCGGVFVKLVNQPTTKCVDGTWQAECYAADFDLSALPKSVAAQVAIGGDVIVSAKLVNKKAGTFGNLGALKVTEAWIAPSVDSTVELAAAQASGLQEKFFLVQEERLFCIVAPCPQPLSEKTLNARASAEIIGGVSLAAAPGTEQQKLDALAQLSDDGLIVLGRNVFTQERGVGSRLLGSKYFVKATAPAIDLDGTWGGDQAVLHVGGKSGSIEFGCGHASIDSFSFGTNGNFTATGSHLAGSGVPFPPDHQPKAVPATFVGAVHGDHLTLKMTVSGNTSILELEKGREVHLLHCL